MSRRLHPELSAARRRQLLRRAARLFDGGRFFSAHECWEEVWRSTAPEPRDLFQGLVQLAAAFHHLEVRRRSDVALRVLAKARRRLERVDEGEAAAAGVALRRLLGEVGEWERWLARPGERGNRPAAVRLRPAGG